MICPAYITSTRSAICATRPISWVIRITAIPRSFCSSFKSCMICAWMVTSRAVVGSSAIRSLGRQDKAMAIITRWRWPPESKWGYFFITEAASGIPTFSSRETARLNAASLSRCMWTRMLSVICRPMVNTGFKEVSGSWKIIVTASPRILSSSFSDILSRSRPSNRAFPALTLPPRPSRLMRDREVTLFPQPDSPTIQTISPGST